MEDLSVDKLADFIADFVEGMTYVFEDGAKLMIVQPGDVAEQFEYMHIPGALQVNLAKFGRYQTGTSIQAPLFFSKENPKGCNNDTLKSGSSRNKAGSYAGFLLMMDGDCTFEEKARNA